MQIVAQYQKQGEIEEGLTAIGKVFGKIRVYCDKKQHPYEGKVTYEAIALRYRPTIPGLFFHFLRVWLFRQKCDFSHDSN